MQDFPILYDFFLTITQVLVAHRFLYMLSDVYRCPEGRKTYGLVHLLSGSLEYTFSDGLCVHARAGDTLFLRPEDAYQVYCSEECLHYTVNFSVQAESVEGNVAQKVLFGGAPVLYRETEAFREDLFEDICRIWASKQPGFRMRAVSLCYKMLEDFLQKQQSTEADGAATMLSPARAYLEAHWNEKTTLAELARMCHISTTYFRHLFVRVFGICPLQYRDSLRLLHAKDYLLSEKSSIARIADRCGFADANYFSRFFKKHTGVSPVAYRNR